MSDAPTRTLALERWMAGEEVPASGTSGQFRQVQPKDGAPPSNEPARDEKNKAKG